MNQYHILFSLSVIEWTQRTFRKGTDLASVNNSYFNSDINWPYNEYTGKFLTI